MTTPGTAGFQPARMPPPPVGNRRSQGARPADRDPAGIAGDLDLEDPWALVARYRAHGLMHRYDPDAPDLS